MDIYYDGYCVLKKIDDKRGLYADMTLNYYDMPLRWTYKIAEYFENRNYKQGFRLLDMIQDNYNRKRGLTV